MCFRRDFALASPHSQPSFSSFSDDVIVVLAFLFPSLFLFFPLPVSVCSLDIPFDFPQPDVERSLFLRHATFLTSAGDRVHGLVIFVQRTYSQLAFNSRIQVRRRKAIETKQIHQWNTHHTVSCVLFVEKPSACCGGIKPSFQSDTHRCQLVLTTCRDIKLF